MYSSKHEGTTRSFRGDVITANSDVSSVAAYGLRGSVEGVNALEVVGFVDLFHEPRVRFAQELPA